MKSVGCIKEKTTMVPSLPPQSVVQSCHCFDRLLTSAVWQVPCGIGPRKCVISLCPSRSMEGLSIGVQQVQRASGEPQLYHSLVLL